MLRAEVHSAALQDRAAVPLLLDGRRRAVPAAGARLGRPGLHRHRQGVDRAASWAGRVEVVQHPPKPRGAWVLAAARASTPGGFAWSTALSAARRASGASCPRRWVVERTFAWLGHSRRLARTTSACRHRRGPDLRHHDPPHGPSPRQDGALTTFHTAFRTRDGRCRGSRPSPAR